MNRSILKRGTALLLAALLGAVLLPDFSLSVGAQTQNTSAAAAASVDNEKPVITDVKITDITAAGYTVTCKVTDNVGVDRVAFPTWTLLNDQDDLPSNWGISQLGTKNGDVYTFQVKASEHNNETGKYVTHIYAYDAQGNWASYSMDVVEVEDPVPETPTPEEFLPDTFEPDEDEGPPALWPENPNSGDTDTEDPQPDTPELEDPAPDAPQPEDSEPVEPEYEIVLRAAADYELQGSLLTNVKPATPVRSLLNQFTNKTLKVLDSSGNEITGFQQVGTGATVNLYADGRLLKSVTVVVRGDVDGNGKVDTTDYMRIKAAFFEEITLTALQEVAADVDESGSVDTTDYMRIKAHFLDQFDLNS